MLSVSRSRINQILHLRPKTTSVTSNGGTRLRNKVFKGIGLGGFGLCSFAYGRFDLTPLDYPEMIVRTGRLGRG